MTADEIRDQARYMLDTRTVNTIEQYVWLWRSWYWWRAVLWLAAVVTVVIVGQWYTPLVVGFCLGWLVCHLQTLSALAKQNEILDYFVDWSKVHAAAGRSADDQAAKAN